MHCVPSCCSPSWRPVINGRASRDRLSSLTAGPDHPITITPTGRRVVVRSGDQVIAESERALTLEEANYGPAQYLPLEDVDPSILRPTDHETDCPDKGDASYYTAQTADGELENVIWTYREPYEAVAEIAGHVAFYPDRVQIEVG